MIRGDDPPEIQSLTGLSALKLEDAARNDPRVAKAIRRLTTAPGAKALVRKDQGGSMHVESNHTDALEASEFDARGGSAIEASENACVASVACVTPVGRGGAYSGLRT